MRLICDDDRVLSQVNWCTRLRLQTKVLWSRRLAASASCSCRARRTPSPSVRWDRRPRTRRSLSSTSTATGNACPSSVSVLRLTQSSYFPLSFFTLYCTLLLLPVFIYFPPYCSSHDFTSKNGCFCGCLCYRISGLFKLEQVRAFRFFGECSLAYWPADVI